MEIRPISPSFAAAPQIGPEDVPGIAAAGYKTIVCNRPDGEADNQPRAAQIAEAARAAGLEYRFLPIRPGRMTPEAVARFDEVLKTCKGPILAYCRTGNRSSSVWALARARLLSPQAILAATAQAGYDLEGLKPLLDEAFGAPVGSTEPVRYDVLVIGGGAGGIAAAASLLKRRQGLKLAIVEPSEHHDYQPGWTLVGAGLLDRADTVRRTADILPKGAKWIRGAVASFDPDTSEVTLEDGARFGYRVLLVAPGLKLDWDAVPGLRETLGEHGVTSNYRGELAPYTRDLVRGMRSGRALFTAPPLPYKCPAAPHKALFMSADTWRRAGVLDEIDVTFCTAAERFFHVPAFAPALDGYARRYGVNIACGHTLVAVDGPARRATLQTGDGAQVEHPFDMLHVSPPQAPLDVVAGSPLADAQGWVDVDPGTLRHTRFDNIFGLGDGCSTPNAKTAAAVRKQAPVAAVNALATLDGTALPARYDGYGSCPVTVERGKVVLAEFGYDGAPLPSLPTWLIDGTRPSHLAWMLKERLFPPIYWQGMFKGREYLAGPQMTFRPVAQD
ncbi:bifunctional protein tyrosine phosphatase family protein/NAD(P)/FAD-dependent oxidoreductase [Rhodovulum adriaticum]|uniref:Sulfide:quinone oxidoreductase n=1 Tax=Rhodovulum adriaticum TaxID=35804 RepID=A0A4R2NP73_RHOAD|nr:bifunctional protein tyrosine phosphatase family protein/NAD(P)/FAD-dependent oxidoreductase [Rhodovulum adriaticum]MBK1634492.1 TIGR01244 family protein [Rhodovulum adriaticum]TCP23138.1 sulfide:quinone oxidoreductase [Rhodovulum adriaticum]